MGIFQKIKRHAAVASGDFGAMFKGVEIPPLPVAVNRLIGLGYRVSEAGDAAGGLSRLCGGDKIDLLVSDIGLPGDLNGAQLVERASELHPELKYLLTGIKRSAAVYHHQHISKPDDG